MPSTIRQEVGGEMTRRSCLVEVEEELAKEMEEGSHHHHLEGMEINLVANIDRRVSLMVMYIVQGAAIVEVLSALAKRFKKPSRLRVQLHTTAPSRMRTTPAS